MLNDKQKAEEILKQMGKLINILEKEPMNLGEIYAEMVKEIVGKESKTAKVAAK